MVGYGPIIAVVILGVFHGVNPGMGWLFGTFMGIQRKSTKAVLTTTGVVSAGHIAADLSVVGAYVVVAEVLGVAALVAGGIAVGYGIYRLVRGERHRATRLNISHPQLAWWGFLAAAVHGSGLTLVPFFAVQSFLFLGLFHWLAFAGTMLAVALAFTYVFALSLLRKVWFNFNVMWSGVLIVVGGVMILNYFTGILSS